MASGEFPNLFRVAFFESVFVVVVQAKRLVIDKDKTAIRSIRHHVLCLVTTRLSASRHGSVPEFWAIDWRPESLTLRLRTVTDHLFVAWHQDWFQTYWVFSAQHLDSPVSDPRVASS